MRLNMIALSALLCLSASAASAQVPVIPPAPHRPSPEEMQKMMEGAMNSVVPMAGRMTEAQIEAQLKIAEKPETAERIATFKRNLFEALRRKGFSVEEALQITAATGWPSASSSVR